MRLPTLTIFATTLFALSIPASADVSLADWCVNANGNIDVCNGGASPGGNASVNVSGFDTTLEPGSNTLGSIVVTINTTGIVGAAVYMDYDVDFATLGFDQDFGTPVGSPSGTQSYDLDTPPNPYNEMSGNPILPLSDSNTVGTPSGSPPCCDVSWALEEHGFLDPTLYSGIIFTFTVSTTAPTSGFYLQQTDTDTGDSIYLSDTYSVIPLSGPPPAVPEPSSILLLATAALGVLYWNRRSGAARV